MNDVHEKTLETKESLALRSKDVPNYEDMVESSDFSRESSDNDEFSVSQEYDDNSECSYVALRCNEEVISSKGSAIDYSICVENKSVDLTDDSKKQTLEEDLCDLEKCALNILSSSFEYMNPNGVPIDYHREIDSLSMACFQTRLQLWVNHREIFHSILQHSTNSPESSNVTNSSLRSSKENSKIYEGVLFSKESKCGDGSENDPPEDKNMSLKRGSLTLGSLAKDVESLSKRIRSNSDIATRHEQFVNCAQISPQFANNKESLKVDDSTQLNSIIESGNLRDSSNTSDLSNNDHDKSPITQAMLDQTNAVTSAADPRLSLSSANIGMTNWPSSTYSESPSVFASILGAQNPQKEMERLLLHQLWQSQMKSQYMNPALFGMNVNNMGYARPFQGGNPSSMLGAGNLNMTLSYPFSSYPFPYVGISSRDVSINSLPLPTSVANMPTASSGSMGFVGSFPSLRDITSSSTTGFSPLIPTAPTSIATGTAQLSSRSLASSSPLSGNADEYSKFDMSRYSNMANQSNMNSSISKPLSSSSTVTGSSKLLNAHHNYVMKEGLSPEAPAQSLGTLSNSSSSSALLSSSTFGVGSIVKLRNDGRIGRIVEEKAGGWRVVLLQDGSLPRYRPSDMIAINSPETVSSSPNLNTHRSDVNIDAIDTNVIDDCDYYSDDEEKSSNSKPSHNISSRKDLPLSTSFMPDNNLSGSQLSQKSSSHNKDIYGNLTSSSSALGHTGSEIDDFNSYSSLIQPLSVGTQVRIRKSGRLAVIRGDKAGGWRAVQYLDDWSTAMFRPSDMLVVNPN